MVCEDVLRALTAALPKLPTLLGPAWPEVLARVSLYAAALRDAKDPSERSRLSAELWLTFRDYPAAKPLLQQALIEVAADRNQRQASYGVGRHTVVERDWLDLLVELQQRLKESRGSELEVRAPERREITVTGHDLDGAVVVDFKTGQKYLLRFGIAPRTAGNLAKGNVSVDDVPPEGIQTRWVVTSADVEFLREQSNCAVQRVAQTWRAEFDLFIPESGPSDTRQLAVLPGPRPGNLLATIYIVSRERALDFYREVSVRLAGAPVITADESWKAAQHTHVRTTHEWTTPREHIQISIRDRTADVSTKRYDVQEYTFCEPFTATDNLLSGAILSVRVFLEKFREEHEGYLNDLDSSDMGSRLAQPDTEPSWRVHPYGINGWQPLPDQADGPHKSAFAQVQRSQEWRDLASAGYALFDDCFPQGGRLRTLLGKLLPGSRIDFLWTDQSGAGWVSHVPWALMYMEPVDITGKTPPDPEKFLGLRFRIASRSWSVNNGSVVLGGKDAAHALHLLYWGRKPGDDVALEAQWQADEYGKWTQSAVLPDTARPDLKQQIVLALDAPAPSPMAVVYFYCHCSVGDGAQPFLRFGNTSKREDTLTRSDLSQRPIPDGPLVFANACSTSQADPHMTSELERSFFRRGVRAFIGSEAKVPIKLASKFAWLYFQYFFRRVDPDPMAAGEALMQARMFLWTQYQNVGGLFYSLTNQYDLFLASNDEVLALRRR